MTHGYIHGEEVGDQGRVYEETTMRRERALKIVLMLVELLFTVMIYPLVQFVKQEPALGMTLSR
jgi:hypothetical protein